MSRCFARCQILVDCHVIMIHFDWLVQDQDCFMYIVSYTLYFIGLTPFTCTNSLYLLCMLSIQILCRQSRPFQKCRYCICASLCCYYVKY